MVGKYLVVMGSLNTDELYCHVLESFKTLKEAEEYSNGVFQILKIPEPIIKK